MFQGDYQAGRVGALEGGTGYCELYVNQKTDQGKDLHIECYVLEKRKTRRHSQWLTSGALKDILPAQPVFLAVKSGSKYIELKLEGG